MPDVGMTDATIAMPQMVAQSADIFPGNTRHQTVRLFTELHRSSLIRLKQRSVASINI